MDVLGFLDYIRSKPHLGGRIVHVQKLPARQGRYAQPTRPIHPALKNVLRMEGIEKLFLHQARAFDLVGQGKDVVVVTGTASGKTLCYNLPVLQTLLENPDARAMYVFPAKALAQDQLATLKRLAELSEDLSGILRPATYDGDTPSSARSRIRRQASVVLTNPDMLHQGLLPYHAKWACFFRNLRFIVLDELHTYRGIFGSHVAAVIRRLLRIAEHYGSQPQFICCSATIANPTELANLLTGREMQLIDRDGSPRGEKYFVFWNPPFLDTTRMIRRSANVEAQKLLLELVYQNAQTIVFARARVVAELIYRYAVEELLADNEPRLAGRIRSYRGGYLPQQRREIERELFTGKLLGVCATNALELGIDVGSLDAAIIVGFPGTICSTWQQAGRAGRRSEHSLAVLIAYDDPVDQYLMRHPEYFFQQPVEQAVADPFNLHILTSQLACAAFEMPITAADQRYFGPLLQDLMKVLAEGKQVQQIEGRWYWSHSCFPSAKVNLRTISEDTYAIVDTTGGKHEVIGNVDSISAPELVYPNAVYLHGGESYMVRQLDLEGKVAYVEQSETDYYTQPILHSQCRIIHQSEQEPFHHGRKHFGQVTVTWQTVGFKKIKYYTMEMIGQTALELPAQSLATTAFWLTAPPQTLQDLAHDAHHPIQALVGLRNLLLSALPMLAMCDPRDLSGMVDVGNLGVPAIFIYDRYLGGLGFARRGYDQMEQLVALAGRMLKQCPCDAGCPSCVGWPNVRPPLHQDPDLAGGAIPDKAATELLLDHWLAS